MQFNNIQSNNTHNASFAPNTAAANQPQQAANPQVRVLPPLADAADLSNNPAARNLQTYNTSSTPQGPTDSLAPDTWNAPEYQPIQPGAPYMEKLADEAMNTKKLNIYLKNARDNEELEDFSDAEEAYEKALKYTENAEHYKLYAGCLQKISASLKDEAKASIYKEKAARAFYYLGDLYQKQGALKEAQAAYKVSSELALYETPLKALVDVARQLGDAGQLATALEQLADFYLEKGAITLAIEKLEEALQVEQSSPLLEKLAALHGQVGGEDSQSKVNETRLHQFELQISQDPKNIGLYRKYVWFLKDIGRRNEARAVKERMDGLHAMQGELLQAMQQKLVKQKARIGGLKAQVATLGKQVKFLERQAIHLDFSHCPGMQDADFIPLLIHNPYAQSLNLASCEHLTDAVLHILPERYENLKELNLSGCKGLKAAGLDVLAEKATQLKRLTLDYCFPDKTTTTTTIRLLHKLNAKGIAFSIEGVVFEKKDLNLYHRKNDLTDTELLKELEKNPEITELSLGECTKITDAGLAPLKNFQWLTYLNLYRCKQITDAGLEHLVGLTQLNHLNLNWCHQITDRGLQYLSGLTNLTDLGSHDFHQVTDAGLQYLAGLTQLKSLILHNFPKITDAGLRLLDLKRFTQVDALSLYNCKQITEAGFRELLGLPQLKNLYVHYTCITDAGLSHLSGLTQLTSLNLQDCTQISDAGLRHLSGLTLLTTLNLTHCRQVTDAGLQYLSGLTRLTSLHLYGCTELTDAGLQYLSGLTQLRELILTNCNKLSDAGLEHLRDLSQLTTLGLSNSIQLTDESLHRLAEFKLTSLSLYCCTQLTDAHLQRLAGFTQLTSLNLYGCTQITDAGLQHLSGLTQLKTLDLRGCKHLTSNAKAQLKREIPGLTITG